MKDGDRIEHQLFEYKEGEQSDDATFEFEGITLAVPIGEYPAGTTFAHAKLDYELALLSLYKRSADEVREEEDDEPDFSAKLLLVPVEYSKRHDPEVIASALKRKIDELASKGQNADE